MRESAVQTQIRLALGAIPRVLVQRRNVGTFVVTGDASPHAAAALLRKHGYPASVIEIGTVGEADLQGIVDGQQCACGRPTHPLPFALEIKTESGRLSPSQVNWRDNIWQRRGGLYAVARSVDDALKALNVQGKLL